MQLKNLEKNITQILKNKYVVPLYQRNYAWGYDEITQLLQDIYENLNTNKNGNYFIGSIVVLRRKNGDLEVIDGQQRLTTITLMAKILDIDNIQSPKLNYDSRPEVESFLNTFYQTGNINETTSDHLISHFSDAVKFIETANLLVRKSGRKTLLDLSEKSRSEFISYFFKKVMMVLVEIPEDTDVAHYFEVMNNRGEQLEQHEILKASLLKQLEGNPEASNKFASIWDACSQMNIPIQRLFNPDDRQKYFGDAYNSFNDPICDFDLNIIHDKNVSRVSLTDIFEGKTLTNHKINDSRDIDDKYTSILDFPNFLMQVLRLYLNNKEIPLNGDELVKVFEANHEDIDSIEFINRLLFYRVVFDRFIVKALDDENADDNYKWSLQKPEYYYYKAQNQRRVVMKNTFDNQEKIIKCLSMLQVSFRTKKYKNWLNQLFSWFNSSEDLDIQEDIYLSKLHALALETFEKNNFLVELDENQHYSKGTSTPHFIFNFLDYLLWIQNPTYYDFEFKYRNSVEHHLPQSSRNDQNKHVIDHFGNLCLVSKGGNSRMNNENPVGKAAIENGKYYKKTLPPKQRIMYDLTNKNKSWGEHEILTHYNYMLEVLYNRRLILGNE